MDTMEDIQPSNLDPSPVENDLTQSLQKMSLHNILNSQVTQRRGEESPQAHRYCYNRGLVLEIVTAGNLATW